MGGDPAELALKLASPKYIGAGMQPEGAVFKGQLQAGGRVEQLITMQTGKCYTIVGASPIVVGIQNLDMRLLAPPFYNLAAGQDDLKANEAVIGKGTAATCPLSPIPLQYKLEVIATKGAGAFAVQVYAKTK